MDYIQKNAENDQILWQFKHIIGQQGPLKPSDPHYMGSRFNVQVEWENGEITYVPLNYLGNRHAHRAYLYHMVHNTDATFTDGEPTSHGPTCIPPTDCDYDGCFATMLCMVTD